MKNQELKKAAGKIIPRIRPHPGWIIETRNPAVDATMSFMPSLSYAWDSAAGMRIAGQIMAYVNTKRPKFPTFKYHITIQIDFDKNKNLKDMPSFVTQACSTAGHFEDELSKWLQIPPEGIPVKIAMMRMV